MFIKRKDGQCETKVLAVDHENKRVLVQSRWNKGKNQNIVHLPFAYFIEKYGREPVVA